MLKKRIIPILLIKNGSIVKTTQFKNPRVVGDIKSTVQIFKNRLADELCIIDLDASKYKKINFQLIDDIARISNMPLTVAGNINSLEVAQKLFDCGIDKLMIRSLFHQNIKIVEKIANKFGDQAIISCIDYIGYKKTAKCVYGINNDKISFKLEDFIKNIDNLGVGEILLNSVDKDGLMSGYDLSTYNYVKSMTKKPIILSGGCGSLNDALRAFKSGASAIAAGSLFYWVGESIISLKNYLGKNKILVRIK